MGENVIANSARMKSVIMTEREGEDMLWSKIEQVGRGGDYE